MAELINTNVFDANKKFVDFAGLDYFWEKAKAYVDAADKVTADKVSTLEGVVGKEAEGENPATGLVKKVADLRAEVDALGAAEGGIDSMIDAKINALDTEDTAVAGEYVSSVAQVDGKITVTRAALPDWTGAIGTAEQNAKDYADAAVSTAVGTWTDGETAGTGLRKEIEEKVAAVAADAKSYSIAAVTGEELSALGTNVKEAYKLVDEDETKAGEYIKIYKDSALQSVVLDGQELVFTYLLATGAEDVVRVDVSTFLAESEFKDGLQVVDHVVSVKVDAASEGFLTVGADGIKLSGVQDAIDSAAGQALTDAKAYTNTVVGTYTSEGVEASGLRKEIEDNEKVTAEALTDLDTRVATLEGQDVYVKADVDAAIADAKKAGTDAAAALDTYNGEMITALEGKADKSVVDGLVTTVGNAESGLVKDVADLKAQDVYVKDTVDQQITDAKDAAIAQAKLDAAAALADYYKKSETYSKTEVDGLLSSNSTADQAYAKQYTDELFNSITFASNSDIDGLFA